VDFAKREKEEALMFDWLKRHKQAVPVNSINAVPLNDEKPILHVVYPIPFRSAYEQRSYSVRLMMGFCSGCKAENKLLCTNHTARLYGCFKRECSQKLVKVMN